MSDFDTAVQRLTAWLRRHSDAKPTEFIGDLTMVLLAAKGTVAQQAEIERLRKELLHVADCIDDVLFDPTFHPVDENGLEIRGNAFYLLDRPVQEHHMPALREWFVRWWDAQQKSEVQDE